MDLFHIFWCFFHYFQILKFGLAISGSCRKQTRFATFQSSPIKIKMKFTWYQNLVLCQDSIIERQELVMHGRSFRCRTGNDQCLPTYLHNHCFLKTGLILQMGYDLLKTSKYIFSKGQQASPAILPQSMHKMGGNSDFCQAGASNIKPESEVSLENSNLFLKLTEFRVAHLDSCVNFQFFFKGTKLY